MKKIISIALGLAVVATMATTAFAETLNATNGLTSKNIPITVKYDATATTATTVLSADVVWEDLSFTYNASGDKGTWNPADHTYTGGSATGSFENTKKPITVVNHSNSAINITAASTASAVTTATASLDKTSANLPTSDDANFMGGKINDNKATFNVGMTGSMEQAQQGQAAANVVITIAEAK